MEREKKKLEAAQRMRERLGLEDEVFLTTWGTRVAVSRVVPTELTLGQVETLLKAGGLRGAAAALESRFGEGPIRLVLPGGEG